MPRQASEWGGFQRSSSIIEFVPISVANQLTSSMSRALYVISALSKSHHGRGITITQKGALKNRALKGDPELNDPVAKVSFLFSFFFLYLFLSFPFCLV